MSNRRKHQVSSEHLNQRSPHHNQESKLRTHQFLLSHRRTELRQSLSELPAWSCIIKLSAIVMNSFLQFFRQLHLEDLSQTICLLESQPFRGVTQAIKKPTANMATMNALHRCGSCRASQAQLPPASDGQALDLSPSWTSPRAACPASLQAAF